MQSELQDCSKYLNKAIEFVQTKLLSLKEQAVNYYNKSQQQLCNTTLEQPSLTITNSSIATTAAKRKTTDLLSEKK